MHPKLGQQFCALNLLYAVDSARRHNLNQRYETALLNQRADARTLPSVFSARGEDSFVTEDKEYPEGILEDPVVFVPRL